MSAHNVPGPAAGAHHPAAAATAVAGRAAPRLVIVTNIPVPYRQMVYDLVAQEPGVRLHVLYCSHSEPDRHWNIPEGHYEHGFLKERYLTRKGRYIHCNPDVWHALRQLQPDVVLTTGFNPTHLAAFAYARLHGVSHIAMTDGTAASEHDLSPTHRWVRRYVFAHSAAFVGASEGSLSLFRTYGLPEPCLFKSNLCAAMLPGDGVADSAKSFDFVFAGRFVARKNPLFALETAAATARALGRPVRLLFLGSGELEPLLRSTATALAPDVEATFIGDARQEELLGWYARARLHLFPTTWDPWGVVANEACAVGVPTLVSPHAGVVGELIRDGETGRVLPLQVDAWAQAATQLLQDDAARGALGARALRRAADYSPASAAAGIAQAFHHASRTAW